MDEIIENVKARLKQSLNNFIILTVPALRIDKDKVLKLVIILLNTDGK